MKTHHILGCVLIYLAAGVFWSVPTWPEGVLAGLGLMSCHAALTPEKMKIRVNPENGKPVSLIVRCVEISGIPCRMPLSKKPSGYNLTLIFTTSRKPSLSTIRAVEKCVGPDLRLTIEPIKGETAK